MTGGSPVGDRGSVQPSEHDLNLVLVVLKSD